MMPRFIVHKTSVLPGFPLTFIPSTPRMQKRQDPAIEIIKAKADDAFNKNDFIVALALYSFISNIDPCNGIYHLNRSLANLRLQRWSNAAADATKALELCGTTVHKAKAYFRRCQARRELYDILGAKEDLDAFLSNGGSAKTAQIEAEKLEAIPLSADETSIRDDIADVADLLSNTLKLAASEADTVYEIRPSSGKALGAFATKLLRRGDLILAETPIVPVDDPTPQNIVTSFKQLSPRNLSRCLLLHNVHPQTGIFEGIFSTNAFSQSGIVFEASRFNHSCSPNARYAYHEPSKRERIIALTDIAEGEEIYVSYLQSRNVYGSSRSERRQTLSTRYQFCCTCSACDDANYKKSDRRRQEIGMIWKSLPMMSDGRKILTSVVRAITLMREDGYLADADDFAVDAAAICAGHSDWESCEY
ncbi:hypothetical protein J3R30DRAFT_625746 [Lentinula aciculospora]|uniref:SET domain-containing protein n=1 Tax=Lentinula aciculospora TaxID=153920 RepID=A0A9W9A5I2_9AGAR|nr:hypothetical protein J3R30DRAFT_625746 [Lentinula aciculospora]